MYPKTGQWISFKYIGSHTPYKLSLTTEDLEGIPAFCGTVPRLCLNANNYRRLLESPFFLLIYAFSLYGTTSAAANRHPFPFKYIKQGLSYYAWAVCLLPRGKTSAPVRQSLSWQPTNFLSKLSKLLKVCFVRFEVFMFLTYGLS